MLFDTHCHLDFKDFDDDRQDVLKRAKDAGVGYILNVASSFDSCHRSLQLARMHERIYSSIGIHPHDASELTDERFNRLRELSKEKKVVAIGEVGLDFYRNLSPIDCQRQAFLKFIQLAKERNLPLIIHARSARPNGHSDGQAQDDVIDILSESLKAPIRAVMHCFGGNADFLKKVLDMGLSVSFTCNITFSKADNLREIIKLVPRDRLLLETDAPFLAPQALRGKRNEPAYLTYLLKEISGILNISEEELARQTTENAKQLFNIE